MFVRTVPPVSAAVPLAFQKVQAWSQAGTPSTVSDFSGMLLHQKSAEVLNNL